MLPYGYLGMADLVLERNAEFQQLASQELARRRLGPFAPEIASARDESEPSEAPAPIDPEVAHARLQEAQAEQESKAPPAWNLVPKPLSRWLALLPPLPRRLVIVAGLLLAVTLGVQWESAGEMTFAARLLLNAWIAAAFTAAIATLRFAGNRLENKSLVVGLGLAVLFTLGTLTKLVA